MRFDTFSMVAVAALLSSLTCACGSRSADEQKAKAARPPVLPASNDPLDQLVVRQAAKHAGGMLVHDNPFRGNLAEGAQQDFLIVLLGGHCYKAIGVADDNVGDLDLSLVDPNGVQVQQDVARDAFPVLGMESPLCLQEPGAYRLHVRMRTGAGAFLVRFFKTDE